MMADDEKKDNVLILPNAKPMKTVVIDDAKDLPEDVKVADAATDIRTNPGPIYLRLMAVYEGEIPLKTGLTLTNAFMMMFQDLDGEQYMCPITTKPNFWDATRRSFQRLEPVVFGDNDIHKFEGYKNEADSGTGGEGVGEEKGPRDEPPDGATLH